VRERLSASAGVFVFVVLTGLLTGAAGFGQEAVPRPSVQQTPDGQPDIQGYWSVRGGGVPFQHSIETGTDPDHAAIQRQAIRSAGIVVDPPDGRIPYQPWALERKQRIYANRNNPRPAEIDPVALCFPPGLPRAYYMSGFQILQRRGEVTILYESAHIHRTIPIDGGPHAGPGIRLWMGDSRGRWEGNTLVVDVRNFNGRAWFDWSGNFSTDALHILESLRLVNAGTIEYEAVVQDPKAYTRPWRVAMTFLRSTRGAEMLEDACYEGNRADELMLKR
jgi:hypothetical protein